MHKNKTKENKCYRKGFIKKIQSFQIFIIKSGVIKTTTINFTANKIP
jgi:hypothetical protein